MLTKLKPSEATPLPASRHILNEPTVGVGLPAGESGAIDRGGAGNSAPVEPCETCKIPGAPAHDPSARCHYRPRVVAHCTCRACF